MLAHFLLGNDIFSHSVIFAINILINKVVNLVSIIKIFILIITKRLNLNIFIP